MRKIAVYLVVLLLFVFSGRATAQKSKYFSTRYTIEDGLSHNTASGVTIDKHGFMWFGTKNGMNRYDSYNFETVKPSVSELTGINSPQIETIFADSKGNIWGGTVVGGVIRYNTVNESFSLFMPSEKDSTSIIDGPVRSITEDKSGNIWISTSNGICRFSPESSTFKRIKLVEPDRPKVKTDDVGQVVCAPDSSIWAAGLVGLWKYDREQDQFQRIRSVRWFPRDAFVGLTVDTFRNCLWAGGWGNNMIRYDLATGKTVDIKPEILNTIRFHVDSKGTIWVGTWGNGLYRFDPDSMKAEKHVFFGNENKSMDQTVIRNICEDYNGDLWFGTHSDGVFKVSPTQDFEKLQVPLAAGRVSDVRGLLFHDGLLFTAVGDMLFMKSEKGAFVQVPKVASEEELSNKNTINKAFRQIVKDRDGKVWVSTNLTLYELVKENDGYILKPQQDFIDYPLLSLRKTSGIVKKDSFVYSSTFLYPMSVYKITKEGKYKFLKHFQSKDGVEGYLPHDQVNSLFVDSKENVWIGNVGGLFVLKNDTLVVSVNKLLPKNKRLSSDLINHISEDEQGRLLISTSNGFDVLFPKENGKFDIQNFTLSSGMPEEFVMSSTATKDGKVWLATNRYVVRVDINTKEVKAYGSQDGINIPAFRAGVTQGDNGEIFFGSDASLLRFNPALLKERSVKPKLALTSLRIMNTVIKAGKPYNNREILKQSIRDVDEIEITHREKEFSIELSLLDYQKSKSARYQYLLEGAGAKWVDLGSSRFVSFTKLPAKTYTFRARAITSSGDFVELRKQLIIDVIPPWWETWWFRIGSVIVVILGAISFYLYRMRAIKAQNRELERQVQLRTQEIRQQSEEIASQRDNLAEQRQQLIESNIQLQEKQDEILTQNAEIKQQSEEIAAQRDQVQKQKDEIQAGLNNMQKLSEFGKELTSTLDLQSVYGRVFSYVSTMVKTDAFGIGFFREGKGIIEYQAFYEKGKEVTHFTSKFDPTQSFSSWAIANNKEILENNIELNSKLYFEAQPRVLPGFVPNSVMVFPLVDEKQVVGVFSVYAQVEYAYSDKDFSFVRSLSAYVSIAIVNGKLYDEVDRKNKHIQSSINYARKIQNSILPLKEQLNRFVETFVLFMPKDIVSGDFYWHTDISTNEKQEAFFAVVDCTGHGVPGAFMSMIGNRVLNRIVNERRVTEPAVVLEELDTFVKEALKQEQTQNDDGMDVCLCKITKTNTGILVDYAGAKRNLIVVSPNGELSFVTGTRRSIGGVKGKRKVEFGSELHTFEEGTMLYLTSDGYIDQNSEQGKFGSRKLHDLLLTCYSEPLQEQGWILESTMAKFMGKYAQRDDITVMGIQL